MKLGSATAVDADQESCLVTLHGTALRRPRVSDWLLSATPKHFFAGAGFYRQGCDVPRQSALALPPAKVRLRRSPEEARQKVSWVSSSSYHYLTTPLAARQHHVVTISSVLTAIARNVCPLELGAERQPTGPTADDDNGSCSPDPSPRILRRLMKGGCALSYQRTRRRIFFNFQLQLFARRNTTPRPEFAIDLDIHTQFTTAHEVPRRLQLTTIPPHPIDLPIDLCFDTPLDRVSHHRLPEAATP